MISQLAKFNGLYVEQQANLLGIKPYVIWPRDANMTSTFPRFQKDVERICAYAENRRPLFYRYSSAGIDHPFKAAYKLRVDGHPFSRNLMLLCNNSDEAQRVTSELEEFSQNPSQFGFLHTSYATTLPMIKEAHALNIQGKKIF